MIATEEGKEPAILEYRPVQPAGLVCLAAWAITILGGALFGAASLLLLFNIFLDPQFWHMPAGEIAEGMTFMAIPLVVGTAALVSGRGLLRGARWASVMCTIVLAVMAAAILFLLGVIAVDWFLYPHYHYLFFSRILRVGLLMALLTLDITLLFCVCRYARQRLRQPA